jgi:hypothetical protein
MKRNISIITGLLVVLLIGGAGYTYYSDMVAEEELAQEKAKQEQMAQQQKQAAEAALVARTKCTEGDSYSVTTLDHEGSVGQDIVVKEKATGAPCKYDSAGAVFEIKNTDPEYFKYQAANALVTDLGTGPSGRSIRLYDLGEKKLITEKKYFGELTLSSTTLTYSGEAKQKADAKNCKDFKTLTKDGLSAVLTVEKMVDLKTFLVKEGKTTTCIAAQ